MRLRSLRTVFAAVAACVAVAGGSVVVMQMQDDAPSSDTPRAASTTAAPNTASPFTVTADVVATPADNVIHVAAMPWPGERVLLSVCLRGAFNNSAAKPCRYEADFTKPVRGHAITLNNLTTNNGAIAPHAITATVDAVRPRGDVLAGPVRAQAVLVTDGDTVQVVAETLPGYFVSTDIRISGVDTPEKGGKAKCDSEAARAVSASAATRQLVQGRAVVLYDVKFDKYGGRMVAGMRTLDGRDVAQNLITQGLANPYDGGTKQSWCALRAR